MLKYSISLVIPAFNEESNIERIVIDSYNVLDKNFREFEIIIVNDGSSDRKLQKQIETLDTKLDVIINLLESPGTNQKDRKETINLEKKKSKAKTRTRKSAKKKSKTEGSKSRKGRTKKTKAKKTTKRKATAKKSTTKKTVTKKKK